MHSGSAATLVNGRSMWDAIGRQFRNPAGAGGRWMGRAMRFINHRPNRLAIAALEIERTDSILELGFGPGEAIAAMADLAPNGVVWGVDHSADMLALALQRNRKQVACGQVHLNQGRFEALALPDASIDKVLAVNVVYFWEDAQAVLGEVRRVLKPGGRIAIYATDKSAMRRWKFASPKTHLLFDEPGLLQLVRRSGFEPSSVRVSQVRAGIGVPGLVATARRSPVGVV